MKEEDIVGFVHDDFVVQFFFVKVQKIKMEYFVNIFSFFWKKITKFYITFHHIFIFILIW